MSGELETIKYIKKHGLEKLMSDFKLDSRSRDDDQNIISLTYNQINSPIREKICQECRGLVINKQTLKVLAFPMTKFFNYGEPMGDKIDWGTAKAYKKEDGTLIVLSFYNGKWNASTTGSPDAGGSIIPGGVTFAEFFWQTWGRLGYNMPKRENLCYWFELTAPQNRIIVEYKEPDIVFLGARDMKTYQEVWPEEVDGQNWKVVEEFYFSDLPNLLEKAKALDPLRQEGFVVVDRKFHRLKLKSPRYVVLHHLRFAFTDRKILETVMKGESSELVACFPELGEKFEYVKEKYDNLVADIEAHYNKISGIEDQKEFAFLVNKYWYAGVLFGVRSGKFKTVREGLLMCGSSIGSAVKKVESHIKDKYWVNNVGLGFGE